MHIGAFIFATDYSIDIRELAGALEERGFESLFLPEHTHIPVSRKSPWPGGSELPKEYKHTYDPFVALSFAASATKRLKLGTGICLLMQRDTIHTAKTVATLDQISGGRVLFGVGGGWNKPEMENHGTVYATRFRKLEEQVEALKRIWTEDEPQYHGTFVDFGPLWLWPKPVTRPHPPIYFGGETEHTLHRIVRLGDGWLPRVRDPQMVLQGIGRLRTLAREAGRDEASIAISAFGLPDREEAIAPFRAAGVERVIVPITPGGEADMLRRLDRLAKLISR